MNPLISTFIGGVLGTIVMTVFLFFPRWMKIGNADVVRAVGALITNREDGAFKVGMWVHLASGIIFAYIYLGFMMLSHLPLDFWTGLVAGVIHGAIVMLLVCITVMEHHPIKKYHQRGPMTGVIHFVAHMIYGAVVGLTVQLLSSPV